MKKILFIIGSLRAKSFNRQVANVAKEIIGERADCRAKLTELLTFMKADVLKDQVGIAVPAESWGTDILTLTPAQNSALQSLSDKLLSV